MVRLTDRPDMTLDVYRGRKTTIQPTKISHGTVSGRFVPDTVRPKHGKCSSLDVSSIIPDVHPIICSSPAILD